MTFNEYQKWTKTTAQYPRDQALAYCALGLAGEAGEAIEQIKKMIRNDGGVLSESRREKLLYELGDVLYYLARLADEADLKLLDIAQENYVKLEDRKARNVIKGEGDKR